jgi:hypothetical protein
MYRFEDSADYQLLQRQVDDYLYQFSFLMVEKLTNS